ncbi:hypothetical protein CRE_07457 [Caenorhabditis remanei]|uniref:Uncharacterized protein n=1 Tax=Caenorhabditis remanei TaxID=31234 RepID=E3M2N2_CAERE|nr:hypothetical protein CRE_07457 [Caenorhabditis remanei]
MRLLLSLLLVNFVAASYDSWACGSGKISTFFAYLVSLPAKDREHINLCCFHHDAQYDGIDAGQLDITKRQSDWEFKQCLSDSKYFYSREIIKNVYVWSVQLNTWFNENIYCKFAWC